MCVCVWIVKETHTDTEHADCTQKGLWLELETFLYGESTIILVKMTDFSQVTYTGLFLIYLAQVNPLQPHFWFTRHQCWG